MKTNRTETIAIISSFIKDIRTDLVKKDLERLSSFVLKSFVPLILGKKITLTPEEVVLVEQFLIIYSKKYIHGCLKIIAEVLDVEKNDHPQIQKAIALRALSQIAGMYYNEVSEFNYMLGAQTTQILIDEKCKTIGKNPDWTLLRAVISCFPLVKNTNEEKMKEVRHVIGSYLIHQDEKVMLNAATALTVCFLDNLFCSY